MKVGPHNSHPRSNVAGQKKINSPWMKRKRKGKCLSPSLILNAIAWVWSPIARLGPSLDHAELLDKTTLLDVSTGRQKGRECIEDHACCCFASALLFEGSSLLALFGAPASVHAHATIQARSNSHLFSLRDRQMPLPCCQKGMASAEAEDGRAAGGEIGRGPTNIVHGLESNPSSFLRKRGLNDAVHPCPLSLFSPVNSSQFG